MRHGTKSSKSVHCIVEMTYGAAACVYRELPSQENQRSPMKYTRPSQRQPAMGGNVALEITVQTKVELRNLVLIMYRSDGDRGKEGEMRDRNRKEMERWREKRKREIGLRRDIEILRKER
ncbi:hypothetical protein ElyMa_001101700 [Elysia marginata]|uniref:Uncharacterized protein n=1 Tax=Elysia marginata TaxID=1093978 RepID=A0AAV4HTT7_9GAST|nr:hypothetical protein ElyMa_001101700 [Elysia marginata]